MAAHFLRYRGVWLMMATLMGAPAVHPTRGFGAQTVQQTGVAGVASEIVQAKLLVSWPAKSRSVSRSIAKTDKLYALPKGQSRAVLFEIPDKPEALMLEVASKSQGMTVWTRSVFSYIIDALDANFGPIPELSTTAELAKFSGAGLKTVIELPAAPRKPKYLLVYTAAEQVGEVQGLSSTGMQTGVAFKKSAVGEIEIKIVEPKKK